MSEYLKNLQENAMISESFVKSKPMPSMDVDKAELKEDLMEMFDESEIDGILTELDVGQAFGSVVVRLSQGEAVVGGAVAAGAIAALAAAAIRRMGSSPECKKYAGSAMAKCNQIMKLKKKMATMQSKISLCKNSKDPGVCTAKVKAKIKTTQDKLKAIGTISGTD